MRPLSHAQNITAVFDFDKTIVNKDTGFEFVRYFTYKNKLRALLAIPFWPLAIALMLLPPIRHWGISLCVWLATFPCKPSDFPKVRTEFLNAFFGLRGGRVYPSALNRLRWHQEQGHHVLVVTGSPTSLVLAIFEHLGISNVEVIGSSDAMFLGGVICPNHCIGRNKVKMAIAAGHNLATWAYGYSDSSLDLPLLSHCRERYLINPKSSTLAKYQAAFAGQFQVLRW